MTLTLPRPILPHHFQKVSIRKRLMPPRSLGVVSLDERSVKTDAHLSPRLLPWAEGIGILLAVAVGVFLFRRLHQALEGRRQRSAASARASAKAGNVPGMDFASARSLESNESSSASLDIGTAFDENIEPMGPEAMTPQALDLVPPSLRGQELMF